MNNKNLVTTIFTVLFCLTADAFAVQAGPVTSIKNDPRRPIDRVKHPEYNPIGALKVHLADGRWGYGSGWLGNECLVWTAKHVLGRDQKVIGNKVTFYVGQTSVVEDNFAYTVEGEVVASGNPEATRTDYGMEDWAIIKLNKSIGKKVGFIRTSFYNVEEAKLCQPLEVAGFPAEKSYKYLWWQSNCKYRDKESDSSGFIGECSVTPGNSGGPLLCRDSEDGTFNAIGIINQQAQKGSAFIAVNFSADLSEIHSSYLKFRDTCPTEEQ